MDNHIHRVIITVCTFVFLASGYGMYIVSNSEDVQTTIHASVIGKAESVENEVKRKPTGSLNWFGVQGGTFLAHRDVIFVGDKGKTTLALNDGSRLTIGNNSLIVLDMDPRNVGTDGAEITEIRLVRGDVAVQAAEVAAVAPGEQKRPRKDLNIVVAKGVKINVKKGGSLAIGKRAGKLDLIVQKGSVKVAMNDAKRTEEFDLSVDKKASVIKDVPLEATFDTFNEKIRKTEDVEQVFKEGDSDSLLKAVPNRAVSSDSPPLASEEIESTGDLNTVTKDLPVKTAALPPTVAPEPEKKVEEPPKPVEPVKPLEEEGAIKASKVPLAPTKVLDLSSSNAQVNVELPEEILKEKGPVKLEMSFTKSFQERFLKLPVDITPDARHYDVDLSYLLEVPGFKKRASKTPRLYWRVVPDRVTEESERARYPVKWVALRSPKSTVIKVSEIAYSKEAGSDVVLPLRWTFRGVFVDRFVVTVAADKNFRNIICKSQIPNQSFVDPTTVEMDDDGFKLFTHDLQGTADCKLEESANQKRALFIRVDLLDPEGKLVPAGINSKTTSIARFR